MRDLPMAVHPTVFITVFLAYIIHRVMRKRGQHLDKYYVQQQLPAVQISRFPGYR
mgnify:CR=1 FL=1